MNMIMNLLNAFSRPSRREKAGMRALPKQLPSLQPSPTCGGQGNFVLISLVAFMSFVSIAAAEDAASLMAQADAAYTKRVDIPEDKIALITYQRAAAMDARVAVEAYWKGSRAAWWLARHSENRDDKLQNYQVGIILAQKAVALKPETVEAHFWMGVNMGSYGETKGVLKSLSMVKPIRQQMAEVIRINEHYLDGGAYRVLGVVDYKVPAMMGGSKPRANDELSKALKLGPNDPFTHFYLAEYYNLMSDTAQRDLELNRLKI